MADMYLGTQRFAARPSGDLPTDPSLPKNLGPWRAATELYNPVANFLEYMDRSPFEPDPNFDIAKIGPTSPLWESNTHHFMYAQSEAEFRSIEARLKRQKELESVIGGSGWEGILAGVAMGSLSPTLLIPGVGGARGLRSVVQAAKLSALAATIDEIPIILNHMDYTQDDALIGIGGATVLGAILGSAAGFLSRGDFDRIARDLDPEVEPAAQNIIGRTYDRAVKRWGPGDRSPKDLDFAGPGSPRMQAAAENLRHVDTPVIAEPRPAGFVNGKFSALAAKTSDDIIEYLSEVAGGLSTPFGWRPTLGQILPHIDEIKFRELIQNMEKAVPPGQLEDHLTETLRRLTPEPEAVDDIRGLARSIVGTEIETPTPVRGDGGSAGAARTGGQEMPYLESFDPRTGEVTREPLVEVDANGNPVKAIEADEIKNPGMAGRMLARLNPVIRAVEQWGMPVKSRELSRYMRALSDGGVSYKGNEHGITAAHGGSVEARQRYYHGLLAKALRAVHDEYTKHLLGVSEVGARERIAAARRIELGGAPQGKLSFLEFKQRVMDANNKGDRDPTIPEVTRAAQAVRKELYEPVKVAADRAAKEQGLASLWPELKLGQGGIESFSTHMYSHSTIAADRGGFIRDVGNYLQSSMADRYQQIISNFNMWAAKKGDYQALLKLDVDEARAAIDDIDAQLEELEGLSDPNLEEAQKLRDQAHELFEEEFEKQLNKQYGQTQRDTVLTGDGPTEAIAGREAAISGEQAIEDARSLAMRLTAEARKELLDTAQGFLDDVDDDIKALLEEARELRQKRRVLNRSYGRLSEKQARVLGRMERNDRLNINKLQTLIAEAEKVGSVTDERVMAEYNKFVKELDRTLELIEKGRLRQEKLDKAFSETDSSTASLLQDQLQRKRALRAEKAFERAAQLEELGPEGVRAKLREKVNALAAEVDRVNGNRSIRNKKLSQRYEKLNPDNALADIDKIEEDVALRRERLLDRIADAGGEAPNLDTGSVDFKGAAREYAEKLSYKITGDTARLQVVDYLGELRGPMRRRMLNLPYDVKAKWLEGDLEKGLSRYVRQMSADIELFRATGSRNGNRARVKIVDEMHAIEEHLRTRAIDEKGNTISAGERQKQVHQHQKTSARLMDLFDAQIERLQGIRGLPVDSTSIPYRFGRAVLNWNVLTYMGSAAVTSIPDAARVVMMHGFSSAYGDSWAPFVRGLVNESQRNFNRESIQLLKDMGIGVDTMLHTRSKGTYDFGDPVPTHTATERGLEWLTNKMPNVALFGPWTDLQQQITGLATMARIVRAANNVGSGKNVANDINYLAQAGISPEYARRIKAMLDSPGGATKYENSILPNTESWTDYEAFRVFNAAMARETERALNVPGLERPLITDANIFARILFQFSSFTFAASSKTVISGLQTRGSDMFHTITGAAFSLALGALSYYIWAITTGGKAKQEMQKAGWQEWLDQAIYRSGISGAFEIPRKIAGEIPGLRPYATFSGKELPGRRADNLMGAVAGPSFGKAQDLSQLILGLDDPTQATMRQAVKLGPYQNVFYMKQGFRAVADGAADVLGLPEKRK